MTFRLTAGCSSAELHWNDHDEDQSRNFSASRLRGHLRSSYVVTITLPDGSQYQASIVTSVVGVKTKPGSGDVSFDFEINWQARWEKV